MRNLTPYPEINALIQEWVERSHRRPGGNVVGLYLAGSLAYGDFVPGRSDVDLQAVMRNPLTEEELTAVERLHRDLERKFTNWANRVECSYVPIEMMLERTPPKGARPWWGFGTFYREAPAGSEWIINHYLLAKYGVALQGPDFKELVAVIDITEVRRASARDLFAEWVPKMNDRAWLADSHYQSYLVLNLCRILHTVIDGEPVPKTAAARWTKATYPAWKDLIEEAERWCYGDAMMRQLEAVAFLKFAVDRVNETNVLAG